MATRSHTYYMFILLFMVCLTDAGGGNRLLTTLHSPMTPRSCDCVTALVTARGAVTFNVTVNTRPATKPVPRTKSIFHLWIHLVWFSAHYANSGFPLCVHVKDVLLAASDQSQLQNRAADLMKEDKTAVWENMKRLNT